jgi:hypothetical protein
LRDQNHIFSGVAAVEAAGRRPRHKKQLGANSHPLLSEAPHMRQPTPLADALCLCPFKAQSALLCCCVFRPPSIHRDLLLMRISFFCCHAHSPLPSQSGPPVSAKCAGAVNSWLRAQGDEQSDSPNRSADVRSAKALIGPGAAGWGCPAPVPLAGRHISFVFKSTRFAC